MIIALQWDMGDTPSHVQCWGRNRPTSVSNAAGRKSSRALVAGFKCNRLSILFDTVIDEHELVCLELEGVGDLCLKRKQTCGAWNLSLGLCFVFWFDPLETGPQSTSVNLTHFLASDGYHILFCVCVFKSTFACTDRYLMYIRLTWSNIILCMFWMYVHLSDTSRHSLFEWIALRWS